MEIHDNRVVKRYILIAIGLVVILTVVPLYLYIQRFKGHAYSNNPSDWGTFGDYVGGVIGSIFSLFAVIFSLISIYISLKIAASVQANEIKFNTENSQRELEKFNKEIELTYTQNLPVPYFHLSRYGNETLIELQNLGLGPMIVSSIKVVYNDKETFNHFGKLFQSKLLAPLTGVTIELNSAPTHAIGAGGSKVLLKIFPENGITNEFSVAQNSLRNLIKDCKIFIEVHDIFAHKFEKGVELEFFG